MTKTEREQEKARQIAAMKKLELSDEEIADILKSDEEIENGAKLFELPDDSKEAVSKLTANRAGKHYESKKKEKKPPNEEKIQIIKSIIEAVKGENVEIENPERIFSFVKNGIKYKVTLSCPRN